MDEEDEEILKMDLPKPIITGHFEITEEERQRIVAEREEIMAQFKEHPTS